MADHLPLCHSADKDSPLAVASSVAGFLTLFFAVSATTLYHINNVRTADAEYLGVRTALTWFKKESDWINELVRTHRDNRGRSAHTSRSPSNRSPAPPSPNPNGASSNGQFFGAPSASNGTTLNGHSNGDAAARHTRARTASGQSSSSRPALTVNTDPEPIPLHIAECVEAALKAADAADAISDEAHTHLGPAAHPSRPHIHHHHQHRHGPQRRHHSTSSLSTTGTSKWPPLPRVLEIAARRRTAINSVIAEFRRLKQLRREEELYDPLLKELRELDEQLRGIIKAIEPELPFSRRPSLLPTISQSRDEAADGRGRACAVDVPAGSTELQDFDEEAIGLSAARSGLKWRSPFGFDDEGRWTWGARSKIAMKWLRVRDRALELKARRAALGNRVLFAVMIMISARLAEQEGRESRQAELIGELVEMRREWAEEGAGGVTPTREGG